MNAVQQDLLSKRASPASRPRDLGLVSSWFGLQRSTQCDFGIVQAGFDRAGCTACDVTDFGDAEAFDEKQCEDLAMLGS